MENVQSGSVTDVLKFDSKQAIRVVVSSVVVAAAVFYFAFGGLHLSHAMNYSLYKAAAAIPGSVGGIQIELDDNLAIVSRSTAEGHFKESWNFEDGAWTRSEADLSATVLP